MTPRVCARCGRPRERHSNGRLKPCDCRSYLLVQTEQCSTCIYRSDSNLDVRQLEAQIADRHMPGHFRGSRACHLGAVLFVSVDRLKP